MMLLAVSTTELTIRMILALAVIGIILQVAGRLAKGRLKLSRTLTGIEILARRQLTKSSMVAVVRAGSTHVLIGVTDSTITLLAEGDDLADNDLAEDDEVEDDEVEDDEVEDDEVVDVRGPDRSPMQSRRTVKQRSAGKRPGSKRPDGPRTGVVNVLRERTVRRG